MFADYSNSLVNLSCSVLKRFGAEYGHKTLPCADEWMGKGFRNVVVVLLDGMGCEAIDFHLKEISTSEAITDAGLFLRLSAYDNGCYHDYGERSDHRQSMDGWDGACILAKSIKL